MASADYRVTFLVNCIEDEVDFVNTHLDSINETLKKLDCIHGESTWYEQNQVLNIQRELFLLVNRLK